MDADYKNATAAVSQPGAGRPMAPLTNEVMDGLSRAQDISNEVRHRLRELRDRLFGPSAAADNQSVGPKPSLDCFASAHSDRVENLHGTLGDIDRLSAELANRL